MHKKTATDRVALAMRRFGLLTVSIEPFRFEGWTMTGQSLLTVKTDPGWTTKPGLALSFRSLRKLAIPPAMAGLGVDESLIRP